jgi:hypothetical protein
MDEDELDEDDLVLMTEVFLLRAIAASSSALRIFVIGEEEDS